MQELPITTGRKRNLPTRKHLPHHPCVHTHMWISTHLKEQEIARHCNCTLTGWKMERENIFLASHGLYLLPETRVSSLAPVDLPCLSEVLDTGMTNQSTPGDILWETLRAMLDMELPSPQPSSGGPAELPSPPTTPPLYKIPQIP